MYFDTQENMQAKNNWLTYESIKCTLISRKSADKNPLIMENSTLSCVSDEKGTTQVIQKSDQIFDQIQQNQTIFHSEAFYINYQIPFLNRDMKKVLFNL